MGTVAYVNCFSFFAPKVILKKQGGVLIINDKEISKKRELKDNKIGFRVMYQPMNKLIVYQTGGSCFIADDQINYITFKVCLFYKK